MHKALKTESTTQLANSLPELKLKLPLHLASTLLLVACSRAPEPEVVVTTEYLEQNIPIQERPKMVKFPPVDWFVVTEDNLEEKINEINLQTGNVVMFVTTPKGYKNLAIGIADLRRYVKDQQAIIAYYEEALDKSPEIELPTE